jgi:hypothetical protein
MRREQDDDHSSGDEEPVSGTSEYSTDASNYSEEESVTCDSKEESVTCDSKEESGEEPTDAEEEANGKGLISTPVSRKGGVTSDYDTPIADLLRHNRSAQKTRNVMKCGPKSSQRKRRGLQNRKRNSTLSSNGNNEGALLDCCFYHQMSFLFFMSKFP